MSIVMLGVHTEERQDLDDSKKCCPESCLIQKLWNKEKHKGSTVDESDGPENHLDGGMQCSTGQYVCKAKTKDQKAMK